MSKQLQYWCLSLSLKVAPTDAEVALLSWHQIRSLFDSTWEIFYCKPEVTIRRKRCFILNSTISCFFLQGRFWIFLRIVERQYKFSVSVMQSVVIQFTSEDWQTICKTIKQQRPICAFPQSQSIVWQHLYRTALYRFSFNSHATANTVNLLLVMTFKYSNI